MVVLRVEAYRPISMHLLIASFLVERVQNYHSLGLGEGLELGRKLQCRMLHLLVLLVIFCRRPLHMQR
jgi:hypothetical protein